MFVTFQHQAITWTNVDLSSKLFCGIHHRPIPQEVFMNLICNFCSEIIWWHYADVIMTTIAPQITSLTIVYSTIYSGADQSKHQSSASLAFVWGSHRGPVNSPHKWPVTRKMFPFDDVIMEFTTTSPRGQWVKIWIVNPCILLCGDI